MQISKDREKLSAVDVEGMQGCSTSMVLTKRYRLNLVCKLNIYNEVKIHRHRMTHGGGGGKGPVSEVVH